MSVFLDTNLLIYSNDARFPSKQQVARRVIADAGARESIVISTQVLAEFSDVGFRKLKLSAEEVLRHLALFEMVQVVQVTPLLIRRGIELRETYKVRFWDGCILAAAEQAGCEVILSEDLNPGQLYAGVKVENPFA